MPKQQLDLLLAADQRGQGGRMECLEPAVDGAQPNHAVRVNRVGKTDDQPGVDADAHLQLLSRVKPTDNLDQRQRRSDTLRGAAGLRRTGWWAAAIS